MAFSSQRRRERLKKGGKSTQVRAVAITVKTRSVSLQKPLFLSFSADNALSPFLTPRFYVQLKSPKGQLVQKLTLQTS